MLLASFPQSIVLGQDGDDGLVAEIVHIEAEDGLMLEGDFYRVESEDGSPVAAVLLLHMLGSQRTHWRNLIPVLVEEQHLAVLNVDMRGHGKTDGGVNWEMAEKDVQVLVDWLREQEGINPESISIVGASIGSNLAIRGWANDPLIRTAVALSPGLDYRGVTTVDAVEANPDRPLMLVASRRDRGSPESVLELLQHTTGNVLIRLYSGSLHGTQLLETGGPIEELTATIGEWIAANSQ